MSDFTICRDEECPMRTSCKRYVSKINPFSQSYFMGSPREGINCKFFISAFSDDQEIYANLKNKYVLTFAKKTGLRYHRFIDEINVDFEDYVLDFYDIKFCIDNKIDCDELINYHDYQLDMYYKSESYVSFKNYLKGARNGLSDSRYWTRNLQILENMKRRIKNQIEREEF